MNEPLADKLPLRDLPINVGGEWRRGRGHAYQSLYPADLSVSAELHAASADCRGQEDGAAVMGLGQALFERMIYDERGVLRNCDPLTYRVPLAEDLPREFMTITQEQGHGPGPFGSKGAGEATILPMASAIANAIHDAVGIRLTRLPFTPVDILEALQARGTPTP